MHRLTLNRGMFCFVFFWPFIKSISNWKLVQGRKLLSAKTLGLLKLLYIVCTSRGTHYHILSRNAPPPQELWANWMLTGMVLLSILQKQVIKPTYSQLKSSCEKLLIQGTWSILNTDGGKREMLLICNCGTTRLFCTSIHSAPSSACKEAPRLYALLNANKLLALPSQQQRGT